MAGVHYHRPPGQTAACEGSHRKKKNSEPDLSQLEPPGWIRPRLEEGKAGRPEIEGENAVVVKIRPQISGIEEGPQAFQPGVPFLFRISPVRGEAQPMVRTE